jgi:hypothetical protein
MAPLVAFAQSDRGRAYAAVCERYHVDPAGSFSDDVLAHNFRMALAFDAAQQASENETVEGDDAMARTRRMEQAMKADGAR